MMRDTFYFSHDYNARTDSKIKRLIARHGMTGYGIYWAIVEDLYQNANALPTDYESIAFDMRTDIPTLKSIVNDFDLFRVDANSFGSMSVQRRLDEREEKSTKARDSARKRWDKDANALQTQSEGNAIKGKKRKEKESKVNEYNGVPPIQPLEISELEQRIANAHKTVIPYLNALTGKSFKPETVATKKLISARVKEGHGWSAFKKVIDGRFDAWSNDPKMREYLRPETLFGSKFESYLNAETNTGQTPPPTVVKMRTETYNR